MGLEIKIYMLLGFGMLSGFVGGVLYAREVYRPLVEWMKGRKDK